MSRVAIERYRLPVGAAAASAALLWAASPSAGAWWLAWIALAPAAWAALSLPGREGRIVVPLALALYMETQLVPALPFGLAAGQWGDVPAPLMVADSPVLAVALVAIPIYGLLLYLLPLGPAALGLPPARGALRRSTAICLVAVPATTLAALEFARANLDPGGLWGALALTQAGAPGGDLAVLAGPWLLAFLIAAVNYSVALALARRDARILAAGAALVIVLIPAAIATRPEAGEGPMIAVAAIQPGYDTAEEDRHVLRRWEPGTHDEAALDVVGDLAGPTTDAARDGAALVAWPEATTFVDPAGEPLVRALVERLASAHRTALVFPHFDYERSRSAVSAVDPRRGLSAPRPKQRPMWFLGEETIETEAGPLEAGGLKLGALLGVDTQDPDLAAGLADRGASVLVSATHDWPQLATQQRAQTRLIAQATGIGVVRSDWRYGSAIIAPGGEYLADAGTGKSRRIVAAALAAGDPTPYAALGGLFGWLALAGLLAALAGRWAISRAALPSSRSRALHRGWPRRRPSPAPPRAAPAPRRRLR